MARVKLRNSGIGKQQANALHSRPLLHRLDGSVFSYSPMFADGTTYVDVATGPYTYQFFQIGIESTAGEIVGETYGQNGKHWVKTAFLDKYVKSVALEINGNVERKKTMTHFVHLNEFMGYNGTDGFVYEVFGGPNEFVSEDHEDAYMLGTKNIRSLRVLFEMTADWVSAGMKVTMLAEYVPIDRSVSFLRTQSMRTYHLSGAGEYSFSDLPTHADVARILVFGSPLGDVTLNIDGIDFMTGNSREIHAAHNAYGRDYDALGAGVFFDLWRGREATKGLRALRTAEQAKRNAEIRLTVESLAADVELQVLIENCGPIGTQR